PLIIMLACTALKRTHSIVSERAMRKRKGILAALVTTFFIYQFLMAFIPQGVITLDDATGGFNVKDNRLAIETGEKLKTIYDGSGKIIVLTGSGIEQRIMITSGLPLRQFDEIIEGSTWKPSFKEPWLYDSWMIISNHPASDAQNTTQYWLDRMDIIKQHYVPVYQNEIY